MSIGKETLAAMLFPFALLCGSEAISDEQKKDEIEELKAMWKSQKSEIATARIRYRLFQNGGVNLLPLGPDEVKKIITSKDLAANPDDLRIIVNKLVQKPYESGPAWTALDFFYERTKSKDAMRGSLREVHLVTDKEQVEYSPVNSQAMIFAAGGSRRHIRSMGEFREVPNPEARYEIEERRANSWTLTAEGVRLIVDPATGALHEGDYYRNGKVIQQSIQGSFVSYPGGIVFPSLSANVTYDSSGVVYLISLSWVEEAEFNKELPKDTFSVPVPGSTNVFDNRNPSHVRTFPRAGPAEDVVGLADAYKQPEIQRSQRSSWWIIGSIILLALLTGVILGRRLRPRNS